MKNAHRNMHRLIWLLLAPVMAFVLFLAIILRPAEPVNDALPAALEEEAE